MYVSQLLSAGLAKETTVGTLVTPPTEYLGLILPDSFYPSIALLEDDGIRAIPDVVYKADQGPATLNGMKSKIYLEPENCGNILMGLFGTDTPTGSGAAGYTHSFTRLANAQLPSYSWWFNKGAKFPQFTGCMVNKLDITAKAGSYIELDADWTGLAYDDTGTSKTPSYSALRPYKWDQLVVNVAGGSSLNYDNVKISFDNMIQADHVLNQSIYPGKIYSKGFRVSVSMDFFVENATEYNKFLAGTAVALNFVFTSTQDITGATPGVKNSLTIDIPTVKYKAAPLPLQKGVLKINFAADGIYTPGSTKTVSAALKNSISTAY